MGPASLEVWRLYQCQWYTDDVLRVVWYQLDVADVLQDKSSPNVQFLLLWLSVRRFPNVPSIGPPLFRSVRLDPEQRWDFDPLCAPLHLLVLHHQQPLMVIKTLRTQTRRGRPTRLTGPWEHTYLDVSSETFWFTFTTTFQARCCGWRSALVTSVICRTADTS